ncbi:MAG: HK97 family phage prohead protease [Holdemanella porci]
MRSSLSKFKTRDADGKKYISGYFAVFNSNYQLWDGATESVDPHAFDGALDNDIRCLIDHDTRLVLGRTKSGTLTLKVGTTSRKRTHKIDKFLNSNVLNNNYSHIDLVIHNAMAMDSYRVVECFNILKHKSHMHDHKS